MKDARFTDEQMAAALAARATLPQAGRKKKTQATTDAQKALRAAIGKAKAAQTRAARKEAGK